jgi:hypothetical protein
MSFLVSKRAWLDVIKPTTTVAAHDLEHLPSGWLVLSLLIAPLAIVLALVIGLASWILGGVGAGLWAAGITSWATIVIAPIYIRASCGPDTRVGCRKCSIRKSNLLTHREGEP